MNKYGVETKQIRDWKVEFDKAATKLNEMNDKKRASFMRNKTFHLGCNGEAMNNL